MDKWMLSVDPGVNTCGCALWVNSELRQAQLICQMMAQHSLIQMAHEVTDWMRGRIGSTSSCHVVCEYPRVYGGRATRGDAGDLIEVAIVVGAIASSFEVSRLVLPEEWKGSTPKHVTKQQCVAKLSADEMSRVHLPGKNKKKAENVWDAIGIGLWAVGR